MMSGVVFVALALCPKRGQDFDKNSYKQHDFKHEQARVPERETVVYWGLF